MRQVTLAWPGSSRQSPAGRSIGSTDGGDTQALKASAERAAIQAFIQGLALTMEGKLARSWPATNRLGSTVAVGTRYVASPTGLANT
jgi:hypothetical protein